MGPFYVDLCLRAAHVIFLRDKIHCPFNVDYATQAPSAEFLFTLDIVCSPHVWTPC